MKVVYTWGEDLSYRSRRQVGDATLAYNHSLLVSYSRLISCPSPYAFCFRYNPVDSEERNSANIHISSSY